MKRKALIALAGLVLVVILILAALLAWRERSVPPVPQPSPVATAPAAPAARLTTRVTPPAEKAPLPEAAAIIDATPAIFPATPAGVRAATRTNPSFLQACFQLLPGAPTVVTVRGTLVPEKTDTGEAPYAVARGLRAVVPDAMAAASFGHCLEGVLNSGAFDPVDEEMPFEIEVEAP